MATRRLTIQVFDIVPRTTEISTPNYPSWLFSILDRTNSISERFMKLDRNEETAETYGEGDFIPYFVTSGGFLFGSFVRLRPGEATDVRLLQLDQKSVSLNDMVTQAEEGSAGSIREYAHFCLYKGFMAMSFAHRNWRPLEHHVNWLLREHGEPGAATACKLVKKKRQNEATIPVAKISDIVIGEDALQARDQGSYSKKILGLKSDILKTLLVDIKGTEAIEMEDILSATVHIKIKKKELKKHGKALDTLFRVMDSDEITIKSKDGRTIKGSEYEIKTVRTFDEQAIETEMRSILKDVDNGEVVS